jgi:hypothetical protein
MPRRRPSALRSEQATNHPKQHPPIRIAGLSPASSWAVRTAELANPDYYLFAGATATALECYRRFVSAPGRRPLYPEPALCSCRGCLFDDVRHARDVLELALAALHGQARSELRREVARLDARYLRRTLPDPHTRHRNEGAPWWYGRLTAPHGTPAAS